MINYRWLAALLVVAGSGCMTAGDRHPAPAERAAAVDALAGWTLQGRLALSNGRDGGSGKLTWQQRGEQAELQFIGALGRGSWQLQVGADQATLNTAQDGVLQAADVKTLLQDQLGWEIPVDSLRYWVLGTLDPGQPGTHHHDRYGRLLRLFQSGWLIEYEGWIEASGIWLPRKVSASQDGNRVRILIKQWDLAG